MSFLSDSSTSDSDTCNASAIKLLLINKFGSNLWRFDFLRVDAFIFSRFRFLSQEGGRFENPEHYISAVNPCLHFISLDQLNTILSLNSIPPSLLTTLPISQIATSLPFHLSHSANSLFSHLSYLATSVYSHTFLTLPSHSIHMPFLPSQLTTLLPFPAHLPPND